MSNTEIVNETADIDDIELHEVYVYIADDNMSASVRLGKCDEGYTYDEVMNKLSLNGIKTGIDEEKIKNEVYPEIPLSEVLENVRMVRNYYAAVNS